jgi:hypothetical protein
MELALNGAYRCPECWGADTPVSAAIATDAADCWPPPLLPSAAAFRALQERVAKLESAVEDLRRRTEPPARQPVRFLGQLAEEPSPAEPGERKE